MRITKLKNGKSFEQWCIEKNRKDILDRWDYNLNNYKPNELSYSTNKKIWFKCNNNIHKSQLKSIAKLTSDKFGSINCKYCHDFQSSKGESCISSFLFKNNIDYIPQQIFKELLGLRNGNLSYDFYIPKYNLLIEYQGEQHEKPIDFKGKGKKYAEKQFKIQQEHDRRKREYAKFNNINLLEIWYYDFYNIEKILKQYIML